jgi:hypothetical protein
VPPWWIESGDPGRALEVFSRGGSHNLSRGLKPGGTTGDSNRGPVRGVNDETFLVVVRQQNATPCYIKIVRDLNTS